MIFYCKDCEKVVDVIPVGRKFVYKCAICKTKNVAFGTEKSIRNFFRVEKEKPGMAPAGTGVEPGGSAPGGMPVSPVSPAASTSAPTLEKKQ